MKTDRKRSSVWNYFTVSVCDDKKAACGQCQESVACGGDQTNSFTTSNIWKFGTLISSKSSKKQKRPLKSQQRQFPESIYLYNDNNTWWLLWMLSTLSCRPPNGAKDHSPDWGDGACRLSAIQYCGRWRFCAPSKGTSTLLPDTKS